MAPPRSDKSLRLASYLLSLCPNLDPFVLPFSYEEHAAHLDFSTRTLARALEPLLTDRAVHVQRRGAAPPTLTLHPKALRLFVELSSPPPDVPPPSPPPPNVLQFTEQLAALDVTIQALNLTAHTLNTSLSQLSGVLQPLLSCLSGLSGQTQAVAALLSNLTANPPPLPRPDPTPPQPTTFLTHPPAHVAPNPDAHGEGQDEALAQLRQLVDLAGGQSATDRLLGFNKKGRVNDAFRRGRVSKDLADKVSAALARFAHTKC